MISALNLNVPTLSHALHSTHAPYMTAHEVHIPAYLVSLFPILSQASIIYHCNKNLNTTFEQGVFKVINACNPSSHLLLTGQECQHNSIGMD